MTNDQPDSILAPLLPSRSPRDELLDRLDVLSANVWDNAITRVDVENWLRNYDGSELSAEDEQLNALHLLANFNLFGIAEVRELLRSIYRDLYRYPIIQEIRKRNSGTTDPRIISVEWTAELNSTRFLGMGNPSESGAHLLYYFRQTNQLSKTYFVHQHQILDGPVGSEDAKLADPNIKRLVFIDDVLGSGTQAEDYSRNLVAEIKRAARRQGISIMVDYFVMFAKEEGLEKARNTEFDRVEAIHELQASELAFSDTSRIYVVEGNGISKENGLRMAQYYGELLAPGHALGYKNGQLLLGFEHNIPDNTLPIIWSSEGQFDWTAAFPRYGKIY